MRAAIAIFPDLDDVPAALLDVWLNALPMKEQLRASKFGSHRRLSQFVTGRYLLASLISAQLKFAPAIATTDEGAPKVIGRDVHVSIAHSGGSIAVGYSESGPLGVDIEIVRNRDFIQLATEYFHVEEASTLFTLKDQELSEKFYFYWTRKEALSKLLGEGINLRALAKMADTGDCTHTIRTYRVKESILSLAHANETVPQLYVFKRITGQTGVRLQSRHFPLIT